LIDAPLCVRSNDFLVRTADELAVTYNDTSPMVRDELPGIDLPILNPDSKASWADINLPRLRPNRNNKLGGSVLLSLW
jgi:hypothetical protein